MLTYSNIEAKAIGVNVQKTKYILLNNEGLDKCIQPGVNFYDIKSPIHRINLSKLCKVALFMNDNALIKENGKNTIKLNALSPMAEYISVGTWVVVTNTPLRMTIVCESISGNTEIIIKPPVDLLRLKTSCSADNDCLSLLPFYHLETQVNIDERLTSSLRITTGHTLTLGMIFTSVFQIVITRICKMNYQLLKIYQWIL
jgi:hypothetical protein